ncbi:MAG: serine/threonine-protein kinase [Burkholderiales bacterium]
MTPPGDPPDLLALPPGARVLEFEIERVVGRGGFSIVYLAFDHSLHRRVALKEYLPQTLARRDATRSVVPFSAKHRETFDIGLKSFLEEARLLARFDHPGLVKVFRFWPERGTAYMAMAYYEGPTLREAFVHGAARPSVQTADALASRLVDAVDLLHRNECLHRDIAPDNVILQRNGNPVLLDFGAARHIIKERTQALTVILKTGYAPIEQYSVEGEMAQGPWTDVYSLAATLYAVITGKGPPASVSRAYSDPYVPFAHAAPEGFPARFGEGIDRALSFLPEKRPQSMAEFRDALGLGARTAVATSADVTVRMPRETPRDESTVAVTPPPPASSPRPSSPAPPPAPARDAARAHDEALTVAAPRAPAKRAASSTRNAALAACAILAMCAFVLFALRDRLWPAAVDTPVASVETAPAAPPAPEADPRIPPLVVQALPPPREPPRDARPAPAPPAQAGTQGPAAGEAAPKVPPAAAPPPAPVKPAPSLIPEPAPQSPAVVAKADVAPRSLPPAAPEAPAKTDGADAADALKSTMRGAEEGDARAQAALGWAYQNGLGVPVDYAAARKWYEAAAAQGNAAAQNNLGNLHLSGLGVARNYVVAAQWYRKSAEQGYALAQNNLALLLENGRGTFRDPAAAAELYRRAAEGGNANAMYNLGRLYDTGTGVGKSRAEAQKWFQAAADKGQKSAIAKLAELEGK